MAKIMRRGKQTDRVFIWSMCFLIIVILFVSQVYADTSGSTELAVIASGTAGGVEWSLDSSGLLTIAGRDGGGGMLDYDQNTTYAPWHEYGSQVKKIVIQQGVISIGNHAFYDCINATEIDLGDTIKTIGKYAFNCSIESLYIPASVTQINDYAFNSSQGKLTKYIVSPDNLYYSSDDRGVLFDKGKTRLLRAPDCLEGTYTVPDSVVTIELGFKNCSKLSDLVIGNNVTEINSSSLIGCNNLQAVSIGDGITELGNLFSGGGGLNRLTSISIGKGLNSVDDGGSTNTFRNLKALEQINVCPENEAFVSQDGVLYNKEMTKLVAFPRGRTESFQIPYGITEIRGNAFSGSNLTEITVPDSVVELGGFDDCTNLRKFVIPDSVERIPQFCFSGCLNLNEIYLPETLKYIDQYAFEDCVSLYRNNFSCCIKFY